MSVLGEEKEEKEEKEEGEKKEEKEEKEIFNWIFTTKFTNFIQFFSLRYNKKNKVLLKKIYRKRRKVDAIAVTGCRKEECRHAPRLQYVRHSLQCRGSASHGRAP